MYFGWRRTTLLLLYFFLLHFYITNTTSNEMVHERKVIYSINDEKSHFQLLSKAKVRIEREREREIYFLNHAFIYPEDIRCPVYDDENDDNVDHYGIGARAFP